MATPSGIITMWYGSVASIPVDWQICNGTNGTPDLRHWFVMGASTDGEVGTTSGSATHSHTAPNLDTVADHNHSVSGSTGTSGGSSGTGSSGVNAIADPHSHGFSIGTSSAGGHGHTAGSVASASNLPAYYKLFYIMKL